MKIEDVLKKVDEIGIFMYPSMDSDKIESIREDIKNYVGYSTFVVKDLGKDELRLVVRKYTREKLDYGKLSSRALKYYKNGEYEKSLEINLKMLGSFLKFKPHPYPLSSIGICYLYLGNIKASVTYLEVATLLSSNKDGKIDYSELINRLKGKKNVVKEEDDDYKPDVSFGENEFSDSILYVRDMDKILSMINSGVGIKEACMSLGLSYEEYLRVLLIIAREYYYIGNSVQGDRLLNIVKRDKNKSRNIVKLIVEIENNKKFYQYRENDRERLVLKRNYLV